MVFCHCSLAGTAACKYCANNPNAEPSPYRTYTTTTTTGYPGIGISGYVCRYTGYACEYATELGFCQLTACAKHNINTPKITLSQNDEDIEDLIDRTIEFFRRQLEENSKK